MTEPLNKMRLTMTYEFYAPVFPDMSTIIPQIITPHVTTSTQAGEVPGSPGSSGVWYVDWEIGFKERHSENNHMLTVPDGQNPQAFLTDLGQRTRKALKAAEADAEAKAKADLEKASRPPSSHVNSTPEAGAAQTVAESNAPDGGAAKQQHGSEPEQSAGGSAPSDLPVGSTPAPDTNAKPVFNEVFPKAPVADVHSPPHFDFRNKGKGRAPRSPTPPPADFRVPSPGPAMKEALALAEEFAREEQLRELRTSGLTVEDFAQIANSLRSSVPVQDEATFLATNGFAVHAPYIPDPRLFGPTADDFVFPKPLGMNYFIEKIEAQVGPESDSDTSTVYSDATAVEDTAPNGEHGADEGTDVVAYDIMEFHKEDGPCGCAICIARAAAQSVEYTYDDAPAVLVAASDIDETAHFDFNAGRADESQGHGVPPSRNWPTALEVTEGARYDGQPSPTQTVIETVPGGSRASLANIVHGFVPGTSGGSGSKKRGRDEEEEEGEEVASQLKKHKGM